MSEVWRREGTKSTVVAVAALVWAALLPLIAMRTCYILPMREAYLSKYLCHPEYPVPTALLVYGLSYPLAALLKLLWGKARCWP